MLCPRAEPLVMGNKIGVMGGLKETAVSSGMVMMFRRHCLFVMVFVAASCSSSRSNTTNGGGAGGRGARGGGAAGETSGGAGPEGTGGVAVEGAGGVAGIGGTMGRAGAPGVGGAAGGAQVHAPCTLPDAQVNAFLDLEVRGEGFEAHEGRTIHVFSRVNSGGILGTASAQIAGGTFRVRFAGGVRRGAEGQDVSWFVDADGDGQCNTARGDDPGFQAIDPFDPPGAQALALVVSDNHATSPRVRGACDGTRPFEEMSDLALAATGFADHDGATIHVLTRAANGAVLGSGQATVAGGGWSMVFPHAYSQFTYQDILWFVDSDSDALCTPADHRGNLATNASTSTGNAVVTMPISDNHRTATARNADVCIVMNGCPIAP